MGSGRRSDGARGGAADVGRCRDQAHRDVRRPPRRPRDHARCRCVLAGGDGARAGGGASDLRAAHAPWQPAMARHRRWATGRVRDRRAEPGRAVPCRRRNAPRGAGPRVLSGSRPGTLGRGRGARPAGARGAGAVRIVVPDPASARIRRDRHRSHAQVAGAPATEAGTQRSPGGHRGSLAVRAWASALRRGGRSRDARGRRRRSSHRPRCGSPHPRSSTRRTRENP